MIYNRKETHLTVLPEKEWISANTRQEETMLFGTLPFFLYIVRQVALFVFRISFLHSDRLPGHRLHTVSYTHLCCREFPVVKDTTPDMMNPRLYTTSYDKRKDSNLTLLSFLL